jgi:adenine-specific DNA-methyltransferase
MSQNLEKLKSLLAELFQLDHAELDFGIYRIMNARRDEIERFLNDDLLPQVREVLSTYARESLSALEAELERAKEQAKALGFEDPAQAPKVKELQERYNAACDFIKVAESEVFSHLYNFFRRYYSEGDFISQRRYKEGVYAIPYEGEEVKLYWANYDQYYIKTSEYFRDYTFKLSNGKRVHFKLVEADTEKDNNRPQNGKERRFILSEKQPLAVENKVLTKVRNCFSKITSNQEQRRDQEASVVSWELVIRFEYRPDPEKRKQADLNAEAVDRILNKIRELKEQPPEEFKKLPQKELEKWQQELDSLWQELSSPRPTEKNPNRTLLEKHLADYTARNTFDYFIHKDLGGFLRRELDFYIKNEVVHLDDIESETAPRVEQYLAKVKAIRRIAHKIIDFLAQLENFQKKLWLKKKFVVETQYCVTLDRVPDELYPEIAANDAQREEWVQLFAIDEIKVDLTKPGYSTPLTVEFLKANPHLVLDTRYFDEDFKRRLLASFDDLDEKCDGLLVHSENFQALNLLMERYREQVVCIYIDPPFNTDNSQFAFKDAYRNSTWLSLMNDRLRMGRQFLTLDGTLYLHLDHNSNFYGRHLLDAIFGDTCFVNEVVWRIGWVSGYKTAADRYVRNHETIFVYGRQPQPYFNKDKARIPYKAFKEDSIAEHLKAIKESWGLAEVSPLRLKIIFRDEDGNIYKTGLTEKDGAYNIEDTWNCNEYEELHSNKIKRNAAEYTPHGSEITQKPEQLLQRVIEVSSRKGDIVLDFFAGSGTTPAVAKKLNRKFIAVEMGDYFDTDMLWRMKQVLFGRQVGISKYSGYRGGGIFKYIRLESYEDTLNNLELRRTEVQQSLLEQNPDFREDYMLHYMVDLESRGSPSLLDLDRFEDPFNYKLNIATGTAGETKPTAVDLVETFNYLIGLRVKTIRHLDGVCVVTGTNPQGERVLILWRNTKEIDNDKLDGWFQKQGYNAKDQEFDVIYVNGDNNLENLKGPNHTWKVRLIEEEFLRRMFDVQDV